jgi:hypothetical protein
MLLLTERLALPRGDARVIAAGTTSTGHPARSANRDPVARLVVAAKGDRSGFKYGSRLRAVLRRALGPARLMAHCHHEAVISSAPWPDDMPVPMFGPRMVCTRCAIVGADARPKHGEWGTMVESDLPFNRHTAHKLMQIAGDKRLTNVSQGKHLPPSWTTLYELTKLDDDTLERKLRDGTIHPGMRRKDVARENRTKMSEFRRGLDEYADEATSG